MSAHESTGSSGQEQHRLVERAKYDATYFRKDYWKEDLPGQSGNRGLSYDDPLHHARFGFLADMLVSNFDFSTMLDAGCGPGQLLDSLAARGKNTIGIDVSSEAGRIYEAGSPGELAGENAFDQGRNNQLHRRRRPPFIVGSLHCLPFRDAHFDLVWCSDVMEHIPVFDVERSIQELVRVAKSYVVLTINLDNPYEYHPTVLSRASWDVLFLSTGRLYKDSLTEVTIHRKLTERYLEYDAFVYVKRQ